MLAICRGMQVVNVALGGTLHQHIGDDHWFVHHPVDVDAGLAAGQGRRRRDALEQCHCVHHQAVDRLGDGLTISARSIDGITEAYESERRRAGWSACSGTPRTPPPSSPQQSLFDDLVRHA